MNNANTVMLLSVLLKNCTESEKEKLIGLYKDSFEMTEEYKNLKKLLNNYSFDGYEGRELIEKGRDAIRTGLTNPEQFLQCVTNIKYVISKSNKLIGDTNKYLQSCNMNNVELSIFQHEVEESVKQFYLEMFGYTCYIASALFGVEFIKNCKINVNANIFDIINDVTSEIHSVINEIQRAKLPAKWVIKRCSFAGANLVKYDGFVLLYEDINGKFENNSMRKISPFINVSEKNNEILCSGIGNFVVSPSRFYTLIDSKIKISLSTSHFDGMDIDYFNIEPLSLIKGRDNVNSYVISPSELVEHLNRYFMLKTVKSRNLNNVCAYCGKENCNKQHFVIPRDY